MIFLSRIWIGRSYIVILRGKTFPGEGCRQKEKKKEKAGNRPAGIFVYHSAWIFDGLSVSGDKKQAVGNGDQRSGGICGEMNNTVLYTEEETADMINAAVSDASDRRRKIF